MKPPNWYKHTGGSETKEDTNKMRPKSSWTNKKLAQHTMHLCTKRGLPTPNLSKNPWYHWKKVSVVGWSSWWNQMNMGDANEDEDEANADADADDGAYVATAPPPPEDVAPAPKNQAHQCVGASSFYRRDISAFVIDILNWLCGKRNITGALTMWRFWSILKYTQISLSIDSLIPLQANRFMLFLRSNMWLSQNQS